MKNASVVVTTAYKRHTRGKTASVPTLTKCNYLACFLEAAHVITSIFGWPSCLVLSNPTRHKLSLPSAITWLYALYIPVHKLIPSITSIHQYLFERVKTFIGKFNSAAFVFYVRSKAQLNLASWITVAVAATWQVFLHLYLLMEVGYAEACCIANTVSTHKEGKMCVPLTFCSSLCKNGGCPPPIIYLKNTVNSSRGLLQEQVNGYNLGNNIHINIICD